MAGETGMGEGAERAAGGVAPWWVAAVEVAAQQRRPPAVRQKVKVTRCWSAYHAAIAQGRRGSAAQQSATQQSARQWQREEANAAQCAPGFEGNARSHPVPDCPDLHSSSCAQRQ